MLLIFGWKLDWITPKVSTNGRTSDLYFYIFFLILQKLVCKPSNYHRLCDHQYTYWRCYSVKECKFCKQIQSKKKYSTDPQLFIYINILFNGNVFIHSVFPLHMTSGGVRVDNLPPESCNNVIYDVMEMWHNIMSLANTQRKAFEKQFLPRNLYALNSILNK